MHREGNKKMQRLSNWHLFFARLCVNFTPNERHTYQHSLKRQGSHPAELLRAVWAYLDYTGRLVDWLRTHKARS